MDRYAIPVSQRAGNWHIHYPARHFVTIATGEQILQRQTSSLLRCVFPVCFYPAFLPGPVSHVSYSNVPVQRLGSEAIFYAVQQTVVGQL